MTYVGKDTGSRDIVPERPVFETLDDVKKKDKTSALMRPTLNNDGAFVNRSVIGCPKTLENTLQRKDTFKQDYNKLKQMLIKTQQKKKREESLKIQNSNTELAEKRMGSSMSDLAQTQTGTFNFRKFKTIETSKKQQLRRI